MNSRFIYSFVSKFALLALLVCSNVVLSFAQTLVLPELKTNIRASDACGGIELGISSTYWRVRKGDTVELSAVTPFSDRNDLTYSWKVDNAKVLNGANSKTLMIKAGGKRTPGYSNASGFVSATVAVTYKQNGRECSLSDTTSIMIGKNRESNGSPDITDIRLSKSTVGVSCPKGMKCDYRGLKDPAPIIDVAVSSIDRQNDPPSFIYRVTGGKIIGTGHNVKWDLSEVSYGTYSITVAADDGYGVLGKTVSRSVTVENFSGCVFCDCPPIRIAEPDIAIINEMSEFAATIGGPVPKSNLKYVWEVTNGKIVSGNGTSTIRVQWDASKVQQPAVVTLKVFDPDDPCACLFRREWSRELLPASPKPNN